MGEVVDAQHAGRGCVDASGLPDHPEEGVGTRWRAVEAWEAGPGLADEGEADGTIGRGQAVCRLGVGFARLERLREGKPGARGIGAPEASDMESSDHPPALAREVGESADVASWIRPDGVVHPGQATINAVGSARMAMSPGRG